MPVESDDYPFVSTGKLPPTSDVQRLVEAAYERCKNDRSGEVAQVYPALAAVPGDLFGICVAGVDGRTYSAGAAEHPFAIMSASKPFVFALICENIGAAAAREKLGVNATGYPFNSILPLELSTDGRTNPMVNSGAIATTSLITGDSIEDKWRSIWLGLSRFAGRDLPMNEEVLLSASKTNLRNRSIVQILHSLDRVYCDPMEALDLYTRQCSLNVTAVDLAVMGATLADGGVNPLTKEHVVSSMACHHTLAVMATAGLYETSGDWLYEVGLPGKSGIGGGIVTISPGKGGVGTFAPLLDATGNSVKGRLATRYLSQQLGMDLFVSKPDA